MSSIVICIDGTWNDPSDVADPDSDITNVLKLHNALAKGQPARYLPGVGNEAENGWWGKAAGGLFGSGAKAKRNQAYDWLCRQYLPGDKIFIFGFSRGAAIARMLAAFVCEKKGWPVEFLGCWDTVAAFGIPVDILGFPFQRTNLFHDLHVAANVKRAVHLMAIDETRDAFSPSLMNKRDGTTEVWMPGVHSDVGGGYKDSGLSDSALYEMVLAAAESGLEFNVQAMLDIRPDACGRLHHHGLGYKKSQRRVGVMMNDELVAGLLPRISPEVYRRMEALPFYRPRNVLEPDRFKVVA